MYRSILLPSIAALSLLGFVAHTHADHPTIAFGSEAAGPIGTIPTVPLPAGNWSAGFRTENVNFDRFSDGELAGSAAAGEEDVHSVDQLVNASVSVAYGVTDDLTLSARLPYVDRQDIREGEIEDGEPETHDHGDSNGMGDLSLLAQYRFFASQGVSASVIGGVKAPTGKTDVKDGGEKLETEFQPGTGSWDWLFGASASANSGRIGFHGNVLYHLTTEGSQNTEIGDAVFYNLGFVYGLSSDDGEAHQKHGHSHLKWDLMLELNGEYREKNKIGGRKEDNSGGDVIFLSPGIRVSSPGEWSLFLSLAKSIYDDFNGRQTDVDYRLVGGIGFAF
jgi:hypothetical protein